MGNIFILFFVVLIILAIAFRADFVLILLYLMGGIFVINQWWSRRAMRSVSVEREFTSQAFFGEKIPVQLTITNTGYLPVVWMHIREALPMELAPEGTRQQVVYIGPKASVDMNYILDCSHRGYYPIGPLNLISGDLLGLLKQQHLMIPAEYLTVYPKTIPLARVNLPTHSPIGTLRHYQPLFEDPARSRGKREYLPGDSLRRIDWKASANLNRLQVKLFEPSIALETMIYLNMNRDEYEVKDLFRASELAIVAAASIANWISKARQSVGLATNGLDPLEDGGQPSSMSPKSGQRNLMRILEVLARIQTGDSMPFVDLIYRQSVHLSWGTTLVIVANRVDDDLFDIIIQERRRGLSAILILCGFVDGLTMIEKKASSVNLPLYHFLTEKDLDVWRIE